jgi:uncharacterized membrane protein
MSCEADYATQQSQIAAARRRLLVPRWLGVTCSVVTGIMTGLPLGLLLGVLALTPTTPMPPPSKPLASATEPAVSP